MESAEANVEVTHSSEKRQQLEEVLRKYGSAAADRHTRLEYHEPVKPMGQQQKSLDIVDKPDVLRLG